MLLVSSFTEDLVNQTSVGEFVLVGFTIVKELQGIFFCLFSLFFLLNLTGNISILWFVSFDSSLHTPMYFFLGNLSFFDISFSSVAVPKMLCDFFSHQKTISFAGCIAQMHFFHFLGSSEVTLLTVMSYDRLVAISNPLRYSVIMNRKLCVCLVIGSYTTGFLHSLLHTLLTAKLPFCGPNKVNHFFCDVKPVLILACTDISLNLKLLTLVTGYLATTSFLLTLFPYILISKFLLKIQTIEGRKRAFSTCSSHLMVVSLLFGTAMFTYLGPSSQDILDHDRAAAVLFTMITPALNPVIYTLRNKDMKQSMNKVIKKKKICPWTRTVTRTVTQMSQIARVRGCVHEPHVFGMDPELYSSDSPIPSNYR
ncbi:olfactory receptor 12D2-like [Anomaloglossus baeobatrachus]|uniref:olfactory receptor 12D2-like n=1 Tax=Anomaloglossus baeobatrachus TaxID=238106 RepID=UPI003F508DE3